MTNYIVEKGKHKVCMIVLSRQAPAIFGRGFVIDSLMSTSKLKIQLVELAVSVKPSRNIHPDHPKDEPGREHV
jgi:hypothetical protein